MRPYTLVVISQLALTSATKGAADDILINCQSEMITDLCKHNCEVVQQNGLCGTANDGKSLANCVYSKFTYCDPKESESAIDACKSDLTPPKGYVSLCDHNCEIAYNNQLCGETLDGASLATCVGSRFPYCNSEEISRVLDDCKNAMMPPAEYKFTCDHDCEIAYTDKLCTEMNTGADLASCVLSRFPYCQADSKLKVVDDCKSALSTVGSNAELCQHNCEIAYNSNFCGTVIDGRSLAACVVTRFPYCSVEGSASIIQDCKNALSSPPSTKHMCERDCEVAYNNNLCTDVRDGQDLALCVVKSFSYCADENANTVITDCKNAMQPPADRKSLCDHDCEIAYNEKLCSGVASGADLAGCVLTRFSYCTSENSSDLIEGCKNALAPQASFEGMCKRNCEIVYNNHLCSDESSASTLAACVVQRFPYCATGAVNAAVEECKSTLAPESRYQDLCKHNCDVVHDNKLCTGSSLAQCVTNIFPYCATESDVKDKISECKSFVSASASYQNLCEHNCEVVYNNNLCANGKSGRALADCVAEEFSYCSTKA